MSVTQRRVYIDMWLKLDGVKHYLPSATLERLEQRFSSWKLVIYPSLVNIARLKALRRGGRHSTCEPPNQSFAERLDHEASPSGCRCFRQPTTIHPDYALVFKSLNVRIVAAGPRNLGYKSHRKGVSVSS